MTQGNDNINSRAGKYLSYEERVKIETYKELGFSNRQIARILNWVPQKINNAVNRGTVRTINIAILLKPITKRIFVTVKTLDEVQSG